MNANDKQAQPVQPSASAEDYLRGRYGAYRGHFAWRELEEAFNAGRQAQPVQPVEPVATVGHLRREKYNELVHNNDYTSLNSGKCKPTDPLYTHPPAEVVQELVKTLELIEAAILSDRSHEYVKGVARRALKSAKEHGL